MKTQLALVCLVSFVLLQTGSAQLDRSKKPGPGPAPSVSFPVYSLDTTPNGIRLIVVENHELPTVTVRMMIDRKPIIEGQYAGYISVAGQLLRSGTSTRTKDQLDEEIDMLGANIGANGTSVFGTGLSKNTGKIMELFSDIVLHPSFPKDELDKLLMQTTSSLKLRKTQPDQIVEVLRKKVLYGDAHPYGETTTEESVGKITREKCLEAYTTYFKPNCAIIAVVGDVDRKTVLAMVKKYFGAWKKGTFAEQKYPPIPSFSTTQVALVDRPSSVQSNIRVGQAVPLLRTSPDVMPVSVMNTVLGGGIFRLFTNLREKHSYTYGAYSSLGPDELIGAFTANTSARNVVTDSALTEMLYEIRRIRDEEVGQVELDQAKNYLSGSFVRSLEDANTIANYAIDIQRYKLPKDYYQTYLKRLAAVTARDVQRVARQYLAPDKMLVAVVGSAKEVKEKLAKFGPVTMYDEDGQKVEEKPAGAVKVSADEILARFVEKTGGKAKLAALKDRTMKMSGKIQGMDMTIKSVAKAPDKLYQEISMMGMLQKSAFDGEKGWGSSPMGMQDLTGERLDALKAEAVIDFYGRYKALGYAAEVSGVKEVKGKEYYEVAFSKPSGPSMRHWFGVQDGLKFREVTVNNTPRGPIEQTTDYFDYKDFDGYPMPTRLEQSVMGQTFSMTVDSCAINKGVDDSIFQKPVVK
jgi:zinc protease